MSYGIGQAGLAAAGCSSHQQRPPQMNCSIYGKQNFFSCLGKRQMDLVSGLGGKVFWLMAG
jgi:hypothetical protein